MDDPNQSPWLHNHASTESDEQSKIIIKLWDYFSSAAAGVCQLYRGKIDRCADFHSLMDALSPMDQFFRGSQLSIETALRNGRYMGARCVRLQLRDLVYAHRRRSVDDDDTSYSVPLQILLPRHAGGHVRPTLGSLGKRRLHHTSRSPRCKRMNHKMYCGRRKRLRYLPPSVSSVLDPPLNLLLNAKSLDSTVHPSQVMAYEVLKSTSPHSLPDVINAVTSRRTHNNLLRRHAAPLDECFLSCAADRYRASVVGDPFVLFQDAAHMANLIDPLSKFSVTTESETPGPSTTAKRFRFDVPLGPSVTEVLQQPTTSSSN